MAVETTPGATQNSYATVAEFKTYTSDRGLTYTATDDEIGQALIRTARWLDSYMADRLPGKRAAAVNALAWPRQDAVDRDGFALDGVPLPVQQANIEAALFDINNSGLLFKTYTPAEKKVLTKVEGIQWTVVGGGKMADGSRGSRIVLPVVTDLLELILLDGRGYPAALVV